MQLKKILPDFTQMWKDTHLSAPPPSDLQRRQAPAMFLLKLTGNVKSINSSK